jgi:hypothetical protein
LSFTVSPTMPTISTRSRMAAIVVGEIMQLF